MTEMHAKYHKVYVICASYFKTGGTEVLHQLVYHINRLGGNAYISYIKIQDGQELCNPAFQQYVGDHYIQESQIEDEKGNVVIIPEGYPEYHDRYVNASKILWWLSVDNFEGIYGFDSAKIESMWMKLRKTIDYHLVQSVYAEEYLRKKGVRVDHIHHLADYVNQLYLDNSAKISYTEREDIILYNPRKGKESTDSIINAGSGLCFVPIQGLSNEAVMELMGRAKIYMDFGNHPGKDRMPREAALCGCIVVTGRHGSAAYFADIAIPDKYRIDESETDTLSVIEILRDCLENYEARVRDFGYYRKRILSEKDEFIWDIERNFFEKTVEGQAPLELFRYDKIKAVIWDMDDTFWDGTLSEEDVSVSQANLELLRSLTDHGIINSISSKNDESSVIDKLKEYGVSEYFVFNNINWQQKGAQLVEKIHSMGLRSENVLFIDDNVRNLGEAKSESPFLMTATPEILPYIAEYLAVIPPDDLDHERLKQYRILEKKTEAGKHYESGIEFLRKSNIRISFNKNCLEELERISELIQRTNQLNYTKNRISAKEIERLITNDWNDCAYIRVWDKFGDYGIVGFYCYNTREQRMEHFLFSCRILGMGVEQYVYKKLGCPEFNVMQPVAVQLVSDGEIDWITEDKDREIVSDRKMSKRLRILLKGPCDMDAIAPYLSGGSLTSEFNYVNKNGVIVTGQNHSMHIYESAVFSKNEIRDILDTVPFLDQGDFKTRIFTGSYHVICYSLLQDLSAGLYRNKETGAYISFSSRNFPLTDPVYWDRFINKEIQGHNFNFSRGILKQFSEKWEFVGNTPIDLLLRNLDFICRNVPGNPLILLLLGSEKDYEGYNEEFEGLAEVYREVNPVIRQFAMDHERVRLVEAGEFIHSQEDYMDCINHFSRNVYYEMAGKICGYINELV